MNAPVNTVAPARPTFEEQVAAVDAVAVATDILKHGRRAVMSVPTVAFVAMAAELCRLSQLADLTAAMLTNIDQLNAEAEPYRRLALQHAAQVQVAMVSEALIALGYGRADETSQSTTTQETTNG